LDLNLPMSNKMLKDVMLSYIVEDAVKRYKNKGNRQAAGE